MRWKIWDKLSGRTTKQGRRQQPAAAGREHVPPPAPDRRSPAPRAGSGQPLQIRGSAPARRQVTSADVVRTMRKSEVSVMNAETGKGSKEKSRKQDKRR